MHILKKNIIQDIIQDLDLVPLIEKGFIAYSNGKTIVPPVGELTFKNPPGDVHIKYGYIINDSYYVIKIASGFWENDQYGYPNGNGMMILFDQKTGRPIALLLDEAVLTDIRTAVAGKICAKRFANKVHHIGVLGTGLQAKMQVEYLSNITECRKVVTWGRDHKKAQNYKLYMKKIGFDVELVSSPSEMAKKSNLIITATASENPLLFKKDIMPGTHITAMGSDVIGKRELGSGVLGLADLIIADSISQCRERGEIACALSDQEIKEDQVKELGNILSGSDTGRVNEQQITIADLTGVAVQDIQIATAVFKSYLEGKYEI